MFVLVVPLMPQNSRHASNAVKNTVSTLHFDQFEKGVFSKLEISGGIKTHSVCLVDNYKCLMLTKKINSLKNVVTSRESQRNVLRYVAQRGY